jgi:hypothetical protein
LHPFGRLSNTSGRSLVFDKLKDFLSENGYGKTIATIQTTLLFPSGRYP